MTPLIEQPLIAYEDVDSSVTPTLYFLTLFSSLPSFPSLSLPEIVPPSEVFVLNFASGEGRKTV